MWLLNPHDSLDEAYVFVGDPGVRLPVLFDTGGDLYRSYFYDGIEPWAPFPIHVVIDREGVIRYLAFQNDPPAMRAVIDGLLGEESGR